VLGADAVFLKSSRLSTLSADPAATALHGAGNLIGNLATPWWEGCAASREPTPRGDTSMWPRHGRNRRTTRAAAWVLATVAAAAVGGSVNSTAGLAAASPRTVKVNSVAALTAAVAAATPGVRIELATGAYALAAPLKVRASGTAAAPIVIAAAAGAKAQIRGTGGVEVTGSYVTFSGLSFLNTETFEVAAGTRHVRLTRNSFQLGPAAVNWVSVAGDDAEVDHNQFVGKRTAGVFLQLTGPGTAGMAQRVRVHHNYFADHTFRGSNGGEALRLGVSSRQKASARAIVEDNLFERVNGDQEAISVKSSDNVIRRNTIRDSTGTITLRHGGRNTVDSNLLIGGTTGIRVFGNDQTVINNVVQDSSRSRLIEVGGGDIRDDSGSSTRHEAADRVLVAFNTVVVRTAWSTALDVGDEDEAVHPDTITVADNVLVSAKRSLRLERGTRVTWLGNLVSGAVAGASTGYRAVDPKLAKDAYGVYRPAAGSPVLGAALGSFAKVSMDVDGQTRPAAKRSVGADEPSAKTVTNRKPATRLTVGVAA
jgi:hypothetical protein